MLSTSTTRTLWLGLLGWGLSACAAPAEPSFTRIRSAALPDSGTTSGVAVTDLDGDGRPDLLLGRHSGVPRALLQRGHLQFEAWPEWGEGLVAEDHHATLLHDFDGDGAGDVYLVVGAERGSGVGANTLALRRPRSFRDRTDSLGVADRFGRGRGALALDFDGDGAEELLVTNFKTPARVFTLGGESPGRDRAAEIFGWPLVDEGGVAGAEAGESFERRRSAEYADEVLPLWLDQDATPDLVAFGGPPLRVLRGSEGRFRVDLPAIPAPAYLPPPVRGCVGDFDDDGDPDLYLVYGDDDAPIEFDRPRINRLLLWDGGRFRPGTHAATLGLEGRGVDVAAGDLDLDGDLDLVVAQVERGSSRSRLLAFRNDGEARFEPWSALGEGLAGIPDGLLVHDLDLDGDPDVLLLLGGGAVEDLQGGGVCLLRNDLADPRWLRLRLVDANGGPGYGATVELSAGRRVQHRQMLPTTVRGSAFPSPLHFGLGASTRATEIVVRWPSGRRSVLRNVEGQKEIQVFETETRAP